MPLMVAARTKTRVAVAAAVLVVLAVGRPALADLISPPPPERRYACSVAEVGKPGEACFDCTTNYDDQERCALEHLAAGRERRCISRGDPRIEEVWCAPAPSSVPQVASGDPSPSPAGSAAGPPTPEGGLGCSVGGGSPQAGGGWAIPWLVCAVVSLALGSRRRRRWVPASVALALAAGCADRAGGEGPASAPSGAAAAVDQAGLELEKRLARESDALEKAKLEALLGKQGAPIVLGPPPEWRPASHVNVGAFHVPLPDGWGEDSPAFGKFAWFSPRADRHRFVELRVQRDRVKLEPGDTTRLRALLVRRGSIALEELTPVPSSLRKADSSTVLEFASVHRPGKVPCLILEGRIGAHLRRVSVIVDGESDLDQPARVDELLLTYPLSLASTYRPMVDGILAQLDIVPEPRARMCSGRVVVEPGESCESCCRAARPNGFVSRQYIECRERMLSGGYEERCDDQGCERFCRPLDPKKVEANVKAHREGKTRKQACRCRPDDPLCDCL